MARFSTASAASFTASVSVGCAWQVRAISSDDPPNSIATAHSITRLPASGPTMWTPSTRSLVASARIVAVRRAVDLGAAVGREGEFPDVVGDAVFLQLFLGLADRGDLGRCVDHVRDHVVVHVAGAPGQ